MDFLQSLHAALNVVPVSTRVLVRPGTTDQLKHVLERLIAGPDSAPPMIKSWLGTNYPTTRAYIAVDHEWYLAVERSDDGWVDLHSATSLQDNTSFGPPNKSSWSHKWDDIPTLVPLAELPEPEDDEDSYDEDEDEDEDSYDDDDDDDADEEDEEEEEDV